MCWALSWRLCVCSWWVDYDDNNNTVEGGWREALPRRIFIKESKSGCKHLEQVETSRTITSVECKPKRWTKADESILKDRKPIGSVCFMCRQIGRLLKGKSRNSIKKLIGNQLANGFFIADDKPTSAIFRKKFAKKTNCRKRCYFA